MPFESVFLIKKYGACLALILFREHSISWQSLREASCLSIERFYWISMERGKRKARSMHTMLSKQYIHNHITQNMQVQSIVRWICLMARAMILIYLCAWAQAKMSGRLQKHF